MILKRLLKALKKGDSAEVAKLSRQYLKDDSGVPKGGKDRRGISRIDIPARDITISCSDIPQNIQLLNISSQGVALLFEEIPADLTINSEIDVVFSAHHIGSIPARLKITRVTPPIIGAAFADTDNYDHERTINRLIEPVLLGQSLREINAEHMNKKSDAVSSLRWFQGKNQSNIFIWTAPDTGQVERLQFVFMDYVLEWSENRQLKAGEVTGMGSAKTGFGRIDPCFITFYGMPSMDILNLARAIMSGFQSDKEAGELINSILSEGERRYYQRLQLFESMSAIINQTIAGTLTDLSWGGFSFSSPEPLVDISRGDSVEIQIKPPDSEPILARAEVANISEHSMGAKFSDINPEAGSRLKSLLRSMSTNSGQKHFA